MDERRRQLRHRVSEGVFGVLRQSKCLVEADVGVDVEFGVGMQAVSDPAHPHTPHRKNTRFRCQCLFRRIDKVGIHAVK